jgi:hypothetical protein
MDGNYRQWIQSHYGRLAAVGLGAGIALNPLLLAKAPTSATILTIAIPLYGSQ